MKWLETIRVQTAGSQGNSIENELISLAHEVRKSNDSPGLLDAVYYNHASVPRFFAVRLFWDTEVPKFRGSLLGLRLTQVLKGFGLVDHAVWIEKV